MLEGLKPILNENRVLITGDTGMLGQAIKKTMLENGYQVIGISRSSPDYCVNLEYELDILKCIDKVMPNIIINTAAIVDLERCEKDPKEAYLINSKLPGILASKCAQMGAYYIQISTDHFFKGDHNTKHDETAKITICNEYARTKYLGECLSLLYDSSLVIRTNVVGFRGRGIDTFVEWVIHSVQKGEKLTLFDDFYTSSINSIDFAKVLLDIANKKIVGLLNVASSEVTSKKDFIIGLSDAIFGDPLYYDIGSVHTGETVKRADSLGLDVSKVEKTLGYKMPDFRETIKSISNEYKTRREIDEI